MKLDDECRGCLFNSQMKKVGAIHVGEDLSSFTRRVKEVCGSAPRDWASPLLMREIDREHRRAFGVGIDYSKEKSKFNRLLLALEGEIMRKINAAPAPVAEALKYAMAANYIDFARLSNLDEGCVDYILSAVRKISLCGGTLAQLKADLSKARTLCYLHDNCGEIVLDKILIATIKKAYPEIAVTSVVRGGEILNDVTRVDAEEVGLADVATVVDNGTDIPGTYLPEVTGEVKELIFNSDVVISKGLGNLETLYDEGVRAYFCFMCKCAHIAERFDLKLWDTGFVKG